MTSFVSLHGTDVWSEHDIVRRTEAMIRSEFSAEAEAILNRKATGAALGQYALTADEQVELAAYMAASEAARQAGIAARADMAKLQAALDYEAAVARLAQEPVTEPATVLDGEGNEVPNPAIAADAAERRTAQAVIESASADTLALVVLRSPATSEEVDVLKESS